MSEPSPSQSEACKTESARLLSGCPLCGERVSQLVQSIRTRQLIEAWKAVGVTFSDGVPREVEGKDELQLRRCVGCGFEYSDLECAGGADFYKQLQQQLL